MKVLVVSASKHGATHGIAEHIAKTLIDRSIEVDLYEPGQVDDLAGYDAVILGSAVYAGNWQKDAIAFTERFGAALKGLPVWLFSSGPLGEDDKNAPELRQLDEVMKASGARTHTWFDGKLDKSELSLSERAVVKMVKAPYGDFRDWDEIRAWAESVADELTHR